MTDFDHNLVVTAGAGTGKTALLVERALNLISGHRVPVQALAAITFTEKAAAELRQRLAGGLDALYALAVAGAEPSTCDFGTEAGRSYRWLRSDAGLTSSEIEERSLQALLDLDVASVGTIHSFCAEILRRYPVAAAIDPGFDIDDGGSFDRLFELECDRFFATELGARARRTGLWERVVASQGSLAAVREIARLLGGFRLPAETPAPGRSAIPESLGRRMRELKDAIARVRSRAAGMNPNMHLFLESAAILLSTVREQGPRAMMSARAPWSLEKILETPVPAAGAKLENIEPGDVDELAKTAKRLLQGLAAVDEESVGAVVEAATPLASAVRESLLRAGLISFDGLLRLTRDLVADHPEVRRDLARRYRAILLDEFQDTDPLQYEILLFIAEQEGVPAADAYAARLGPGRLFIVGDPKQSIYRFRGADIEAYQRAVRRVLECDGRSIILTSSFRSPSEVVEPINRLFGSWMAPKLPDDDRFQPPYEQIDSARGPAGRLVPRVEIWSVEADGDASSRRRSEAEAIATWIARWHGSDEITGVPLEYKDIAILPRALTHAGLYAQALRRASVPFIVEGGKEFYERPEVGDLIAFLRAVANPNDQPAVLAIMRSVLGGVPDDELARFAAGGGRLDRSAGASASLSAFPGIARTFGLIDAFRARSRGRAVDEMVRAAVLETPLIVLHGAAYEGAQRLANLQKLVAEAERLARGGLSLEEVIRSLEEEPAAGRDGGESPLADETIDAVRVLSIHKAKGLQYPVVMIPDIGREERRHGRDSTDVAWLRADGDGRLAVRLAAGMTNLAWVEQAELSRRHTAAEEKRVFYVACTRAEERLILINSNAKKKRVPWRDALESLGYVVQAGMPLDGPLAPDVLHRRVVPDSTPATRTTNELDGGWEVAARAFQDVTSDLARSTVAPLRWPSGSRDALQAGADETQERGRWRRPVPADDAVDRTVSRFAGAVFHAVMEGWDFHDAGRLRESIRQEAERLARQESGRPSAGRVDAGALIREASVIAEAFLGTPLPGRLAALTILGREVPILHRDADGITWVGACDLIYRDRDGSIVVADYKTDRIEGDATRAAEPYAEQLRVYRDAVSRAMQDVPVRAEILFVRTGRIVVMGGTAVP